MAGRQTSQHKSGLQIKPQVHQLWDLYYLKIQQNSAVYPECKQDIYPNSEFHILEFLSLNH